MHVTEETISGWEKGNSNPQTSYISKIISFLGYSPISYGNYLKQYRKERGLTAVKLAKILKIDPRTVTSIENGNRVRKDLEEKIKIFKKISIKG